MYAGTTLRPLKHFDAWFGGHQKIDRVARRHLKRLLSSTQPFPSRRQIVKFEGYDGPDGIKRKTPAKDEPWHFIDPENETDREIVQLLCANYEALVRALKAGNQTRAAFEAAWLAHGIVDGLTPAHHYPYEDELIKLRGTGRETRVTAKDKLIIPAETLPKQVSKTGKSGAIKGLYRLISPSSGA